MYIMNIFYFLNQAEILVVKKIIFGIKILKNYFRRLKSYIYEVVIRKI